ncbi:hypothetical protein [Oceanobacillus oncorhynchi]|uniref:hypothetical protein n=1 Tax=Oceanobacillus oncorhynchi TaxID=545501 RepID=UPI0034D5962A
MENRLFIFAYNKGETINFYKGHYDGAKFVPKKGFCESIDDLYEFDYVQFYADDGLRMHIGNKISKSDLENKMKSEFIRHYGEIEQAELF